MSPVTVRNPSGVRAIYGYAAAETTPAPDRPPHRGLPSTALTVVFAVDAPILCSASVTDWADRRGSSHEVCLGAFHLNPVYLQRPDHQEGVQVAVHPLAARRVLGLPTSALTELTQEGDAVMGPRMRSLFSRVASADPGDRTRLVALGLAGFADRHDHAREPRPEVVGAWRLLERSGGRMRVSEVASRVGLTSRHLSSLITQELGIGTKQLADLFRFEAAHSHLVSTLQSGNDVRLADLAHEHGFADHAHLDATYRRFTGTNPTTWIAEEFRKFQATGDPAGRDSCP